MLGEEFGTTLSKDCFVYHRSFGMDNIQLSATSYFRNALSKGIQLSPEQIVGKLDALDQRGHGDETVEELGTWL